MMYRMFKSGETDYRRLVDAEDKFYGEPEKWVSGEGWRVVTRGEWADAYRTRPAARNKSGKIRRFIN